MDTVWIRERLVGDYYTSWELIDVHSSKESADRAVKNDSDEWRVQRVLSTAVITLPKQDDYLLGIFRNTEQYENLPDEIKALLEESAGTKFDKAGTVLNGKIEEWKV